MMERDDLVP